MLVLMASIHALRALLDQRRLGRSARRDYDGKRRVHGFLYLGVALS
jgi:hypothetical protein